MDIKIFYALFCFGSVRKTTLLVGGIHTFEKGSDAMHQHTV